MNGFRSVISILAGAVLVVVVGAAVASTDNEPQWFQALNTRSDALNREHALGDYSVSTADISQPDWLRALMIRGDALNREHGLGKYSRQTSQAATPDWMRALMIRSEALNREHGLGKYATPRSRPYP